MGRTEWCRQRRLSSCWPKATAAGNVESATSPQRFAFRLDLQRAQSFTGRRDVLDYLESIVRHVCTVLVVRGPSQVIEGIPNSFGVPAWG